MRVHDAVMETLDGLGDFRLVGGHLKRQVWILKFSLKAYQERSDITDDWGDILLDGITPERDKRMNSLSLIAEYVKVHCVWRGPRGVGANVHPKLHRYLK